MNNCLGKTLRFLREEFDKTQSEIGEILNVTPQTYSNYESGHRLPDLPSLIRLAQYYNIDTGILLATLLPQALCEEFAEKNQPNDCFNHTLTNDEVALLYLFRQLNHNAQNDILTFAKIKADKDP